MGIDEQTDSWIGGESLGDLEIGLGLQVTAVDQEGRYWTNDNVCLVRGKGVNLGEANGGQVQESVPRGVPEVGFNGPSVIRTLLR